MKPKGARRRQWPCEMECVRPPGGVWRPDKLIGLTSHAHKLGRRVLHPVLRRVHPYAAQVPETRDGGCNLTSSRILSAAARLIGVVFLSALVSFRFIRR